MSKGVDDQRVEWERVCKDGTGLAAEELSNERRTLFQLGPVRVCKEVAVRGVMRIDQPNDFVGVVGYLTGEQAGLGIAD